MRSITEIVIRQLSEWEARSRAVPATGEGQLPRLIVAISRQAGSRGEAIAEAVARALDFQFFDREIVVRIAQEARVLESLVRPLDEQRPSWIHDSLASLRSLSGVTRDEYFQHLTRIVLAIGYRGQAVIVGRGASHILPPDRRLAVRIVAPPAWRAEMLAADLNISSLAAEQRVAQLDGEQAAFIRSYFRTNPEEAYHFDLTVDSSRFGVTGAAETIVAAFRSLQLALLADA